jgi:MFS family permease
MSAESNRTMLRNITILLGGTCSVLAAVMISPALPGMAQAFADVPNADFLVRMVLTMPALFVALGALFVGGLLDRWGRKPVLVVSLVVFVLAGCAGFVLDSLMMILVSRALLGLAVAGIMSGFMTLIMDYFEGDELNKFLGLNGASVCLGGILGLVASGFLADIGWRFPFLIHLIALLILPGVIFAINEPQKTKDFNLEIEQAALPWRQLIPIYATAFMCTVLFFIFPAQLPFYLTENNNIEASQVGMALALPTVIGLVFALLYQRFRARFSFQAIAAIIFLAYSATHLMLSASSAYGMVILSLLFGGVGMGLLSPNNSGWLADVAPVEVRGRAVGMLTCSIFLGQFFSPIISEPFVQTLGLASTFGLMACVSLLVASVFVIVAMKKATDDSKLRSSLSELSTDS